MRHLDLFTGILGFSYAAERVWKDEYELVACCEIDKFCQKIIRKHRGNVEIVNDVRDERIKQFRDIDLLTAGVPCQPASIAGKKRGTADERWLWPETLDIIRLVRPRYALLENVPGLFNLENGQAFNGILSRLAEIGYDCWWETIPACAIGAPHRRDRICIVAHTQNGNNRGEYGNNKQAQEEIGCSTTEYIGSNKRSISEINVTDSDIRQDNTRNESEPRIATHQESCTDNTDVAYANGKYSKEYQRRDKLRQERGTGTFGRCVYEPNWQESWLEVATELCGVDDGIPNRVDRLKSLGNAIVPQVAMVIMQAIKEIEEQKAGQMPLFPKA